MPADDFDTFTAVFRGEFQETAGGGDPIGEWAISHAFQIPGAGDAFIASIILQSWFTQRWTVTEPGVGSPIAPQTVWKSFRTEQPLTGSVEEIEDLFVRGPGMIDSVGLLGTQESLLVFCRTETLGLNGRLFLPGIDRKIFNTEFPIMRVVELVTMLRSWYLPATVFGFSVVPTVRSRQDEFWDTPTQIFASRWSRTQRRRSRGLPKPYVKLFG